MNFNHLIFLIYGSFALFAFSYSKYNPYLDDDGVPVLQDYKKPVVGFMEMSRTDFVIKYCDGLKTTNKTCMKVIDYTLANSLSPGETPRIGK